MTDPIITGIFGILLLVFLLIMGMPIAFLMMFVGFLGLWKLSTFDAALSTVARTIYEVASHYPYTIIPLFILMGGFATIGGITQELYETFEKWFRRLPGGLAIATIGACAGFASISGSSVAATAAMGSIALPEMRKFKYDLRLSLGTIAAGGTLSFLIPPSLGFVVYGMLTEQSIGKLLIAGVIPGILLSLAYMLVILIQVRLKPSLAPVSPERVTFKEKIYALKGVWETLLVFLMVIGGIYFGFINPTEAGAIGAVALFFLAFLKKKLTFKGLLISLFEMVRISTMVLFLVAGATIFSYFLALSTIPTVVSSWIAHLALSRYFILIFILAIYLLLGCFLDAISMMVLTMPVIYPIVLALNFDPIWFGVICVLMMEAGLITPPVGLNVYTLAGIVKDLPMTEIFKGTAPFLLAIVITTFFLILFPKIALFLPKLMMGK